MFIAATQKTGYDIAVHKSQTKTGGRQYGFQRKVKADKKERGQAVTWLLWQILLGMFHKILGQTLILHSICDILTIENVFLY